jgi:hypothetical protein
VAPVTVAAALTLVAYQAFPASAKAEPEFAGTCTIGLTDVRFVAAAGVANGLTVDLVRSGGPTGLTLHDEAGPIKGCTSIPGQPGDVSASTGRIATIRIALGDRDDRVEVNSDIVTPAIILGGDGDDEAPTSSTATAATTPSTAGTAPMSSMAEPVRTS